MAVNKADLLVLGRDLVMKTLDGIAEKYGSSDTAPDVVRQLASKWGAMSADDRDDVARHVSTAVQGAFTAVPLLAAKTVSRARSKSAKKKKKETTVEAVVSAAAGEPSKKDKKNKKNKKDKKKGKDKKDQGKKKKKKSR